MNWIKTYGKRRKKLDLVAGVGAVNNINVDQIYTLGIVRTLWKSTIPSKLNALRTALNLPPREAALDGTYDKQVTDRLSTIDFGSSEKNLYALGVLTFAGFGLTPAPDILQENHQGSAVLGDIQDHHDF